MKKISHLLLLSATLFLSTFFVGCKPQEEPIALEDITLSPSKKVVEKINPKPTEENVVEQLQIPEIQSEERNKNKRLVVVNVTVDGGPAIGATVTLSKSTHGEDLFFEKKTDKTGVARFFINKSIKEFYATAYNDEYASVNILRRRLSPKDLSPVTIDLNLKDKGVAITAILENKPDKIENLQAKIVSSKSFGLQTTFAVTTNIIGNKIVFPPVVGGCLMRVCLTGENIPQCYSDKFNPEKDQEITVKIPGSATLKGTVLLPNGSPVTNGFIISIFPQKESKGIYQTGKSSGKIIPDSNGNYIFTKISEGNFRILMRLDNYKTFETNLYFKSSDNYLNFSFGKISTMNVGGIVVTEYDDMPMEGITVYARRGNRNSPYASCITDKDGKFTIDVRKIFGNYYGSLCVDEPSCGKVIVRINRNTEFIKIVLKQAGRVIGNVTDNNGNPMPGIYISLVLIEPNSDVMKVSAKTKAQTYFYSTTTDSDGNYEFTNVVAPAKYGFSANSIKGDYTLPSYHSDEGYTVEAKPDKTEICNLTLHRSAVLALKAEDSQGNPILIFSLSPQIETENGRGFRTFKVPVELMEDEWYYSPVQAYGNGTFSCEAFNKENGLYLKTNGIHFTSSITNYITLIFPAEKNKPLLTGYVLNSDGTPARYSSVSVYSMKNSKSGELTTDVSGYFEFLGWEAEKDEILEVQVYSHELSIHTVTNLPSGSKNVKIKIDRPKKIIGKVFLENLDTPVTGNLMIKEGYHLKSVNSVDGSFTYQLAMMQKKSGSVVISVEGYIPKFVDYKFSGNNDVWDVGNIILIKGETAKIHGRVVNQNQKPLNVQVNLICGAERKNFTIYSSGKNGTYAFEGVPPGKAIISVKSRLGIKASQKFEIKEGDNLELPDLVLNYTNAAVVKLIFRLPDGNFPKQTSVINHNFYIEDNGVAKGELKFGKYSGWKIKYKGKVYVANEFEITESTDELEIWMREE